MSISAKEIVLNEIIELTKDRDPLLFGDSIIATSKEDYIYRTTILDNSIKIIKENIHSLIFEGKTDRILNIMRIIDMRLEYLNFNKFEYISKRPSAIDTDSSEPMDIFKVDIFNNDNLKGKMVKLENGETKEIFYYSENIEIGYRLIDLKDIINEYFETFEDQPQKDNNRPLTDHQTALFFHYIFKKLNIDSNKIDKTEMVNVVLKIMGKNVERQKVKDQNIYKMFSNILDYYKTKNDNESKTLQKNLKVVKEMLTLLGIETKEINKDINSY